jgi:hypothetical protein
VRGRNYEPGAVRALRAGLAQPGGDEQARAVLRGGRYLSQPKLDDVVAGALFNSGVGAYMHELLPQFSDVGGSGSA